MKLFLQREVTVWHWQVVATLGLSQKRPEITAILALASGASNGIVTAQDVSRKLLADRPAVIGERLLRVCHMMQLLEPVESEGQGWRLSELGRRALANQEVPAQQRGEFDIWSMEDVLHPEVLLRVKPTELERLTKTGERRDVGNLMPIPPALGDCQGRIFRPPIRTEQESAEIFVFKFEETCRCIGQEDASLSVEISSTGGNAKFVVEIEDCKNEFSPVVKIPALSDVLDSAGRADIAGPQKTTFRALSDNDRRRARREVDLEGIYLHGLGTFYQAKLRDVPLVPATQQDADEWAVWLLLDRIRGYVWPEEYERLVRSVREFAVKEGWQFDPAIPTQQELAQRCAGQIVVTRKLLVPLDWRAVMQPDGKAAPPIFILSGRAARGKEAEKILKEWGDVSQRIYLMESLEANKSGEGLPLSLSDTTRQRAIIRRVRQAPDVWLCIQGDQKLGQRWQPAQKPKPEHKSSHPKPLTSIGDDGRWSDLNAVEYDRLVEELDSTFWKRVVQELQPDGTWVSVKPA
jgi:hypothetical protein